MLYTHILMSNAHLMDYRIEEFDPKEYTMDHPFWKIYYQFNKANHQERFPRDPYPSLERIIRNQHADFSHYIVQRWLVFLEKEIIGWAGAGYHTHSAGGFEENGHLGNFNIAILKEHRHKGIGTKLLQKIIQWYERVDYVTTLTSSSAFPEGQAFCEKFGGSYAIDGIDSRLYLEDVDWNLMQQWMDKGRNNNLDVQVSFHDRIEDDDLEEFCQVYMEFLRMAPQEDMEGEVVITQQSWKENLERDEKTGYSRKILLAKNAEGKIVAMTEIFINSYEPFRIHQGITAVTPDFRGNGFGKWLKAEMINKVKEELPDVLFVVTDNATVNEHMLVINNEMGFQADLTVKGYNFSYEDVQKLIC